MTLPPWVRAMVTGVAVTGAATAAVAGVLAGETGLGPTRELVPLTILLALSWAFPVLVLRTEETEAFQLDEAFFVAMALLLPPAGTIVAVAVAVAVGNCARRRPLLRAVFNTGQTVTAAGLGLAAMHLIAPGATVMTPAALGGAVVGSAVFLLVNSALVSVVISLTEAKPAVQVFLEGLDLRALVWAGGTALGLLAAIGGAAHSWALALGLFPMAALNLILHEHARARRQSKQAQGLLVAAAQVHASVTVDQVEPAVLAATMSLLNCRQARIDAVPPGPDEIGVPVPDPRTDRWLVAGDRIGFEPLGQIEQELLEAIAGIAAGALENARLLEEIRHRAIHDPLTDLPNKVLFLDRFKHALAAAPRTGRWLAVMFLDLDQFKVINDSLGHDTGDQVLLGVAARLGGSLRRGDTAARLGGDEFAVLCEEVDGLDDCTTIAERVRAAASGTLVANGVELTVTASVGVVMVGPEEYGISPETLLQAADTAMYRAKGRGRDRVEIFDDQLRNRAMARLETETALRRAVEDGRLRVFYQPILDVTSGRMVEAEALLRIETPTGVMLAPADFIEVAEESGLITTIGIHVLEESCRQAVLWQHRFGDAAPARIAVNLSARQLSRAPVRDTVEQALAAAGCSPHMLALEITETALMEAGHQVREELEDLRKLGVTVGLDDFGTGYSSLAYLKRFPLDFLKIDRCFVAGLGHDPEDEPIVDAIVSLGRSLGLSTVAEGVETHDQWARLRSLGCDRMQGFLFARPQPPGDLDALIGTRQGWEQQSTRARRRNGSGLSVTSRLQSPHVPRQGPFGCHCAATG